VPDIQKEVIEREFTFYVHDWVKSFSMPKRNSDDWTDKENKVITLEPFRDTLQKVNRIDAQVGITQ